jgi:hypothetical protein
MAIEEKRKKNSSHLLQAFRRPSHCPHRGLKKCEGTSAFSEEKPKGSPKKPAGDGDGTCSTEPWSEILLSLWYSVEAGTGG